MDRGVTLAVRALLQGVLAPCRAPNGDTAAALLVAAAMLGACGSHSEALPVVGMAPEFSLVDQQSRPLSRDVLEGRVWVANFIFTSCPSVCPLLTSKMAALQKATSREEPRPFFVSITVDPERDTPGRLRGFARRHGADFANWAFLTGDPAQIRDTVVRGFKLAMGERNRLGEGETYDIMHGRYFVLVDHAGRIRGYYPSDEEGQRRLTRDIRRLLSAT